MSNKTRQAANLVSETPNNIFSDIDTGRVGIGSTIPTATLNVAGIVSATSYYGDGSNLTGIATQLTATIGLSSDSTLVGTGVTLIDFVQGDGQPRVEVTSVDVTSGVGTVVVAPGISVGLAIALGS